MIKRIFAALACAALLATSSQAGMITHTVDLQLSFGQGGAIGSELVITVNDTVDNIDFSSDLKVLGSSALSQDAQGLGFAPSGTNVGGFLTTDDTLAFSISGTTNGVQFLGFSGFEFLLQSINAPDPTFDVSSIPQTFTVTGVGDATKGEGFKALNVSLDFGVNSGTGGGGQNVVPEPAAFTSFALIALTSVCRRRKRSC
ncbi:MAG: hypothetical protein AAFV88_19880 [Planctomycetota bacterium]